jgi:hypothetical protein
MIPLRGRYAPAQNHTAESIIDAGIGFDDIKFIF